MAAFFKRSACLILLGITFFGGLCGYSTAFLVYNHGYSTEAESLGLGTVIGIDLGTTYSRVAVFRNKRIEIIPDDQGNRISPSWVAFSPAGERLIGEAAKNQAASNPHGTIFGAKRLIGRMFSDKEVEKNMKLLPYKIVSHDGKPYIEVEVKNVTKTFSPEETTAMVLTKMKKTAEAYLGYKVKHAVVTVPAYFNDAQRQATKDAGTIAGLNVVRIVNEPTAAAFAYGLDRKAGENILVFDLGGGTCDVSVLAINGGVFGVLSTNGDTHLGGEDFDQRVMEYFIKLIRKKSGKDISQDTKGLGKLRKECERAKRALSNEHQVRLEIESLYDGVDFSETLTRTRFEELNADLFMRTLALVKKALEDAGLERHQIDEVVLVGGSTRIPKVQQLLKDYFDGKELNKGVNPDEAVAHGAAVQGSIISGEDDGAFKDILNLEVTAYSLGIETVGGVMTKMIPSHSIFPNKKSRVFTTYQDQQTTFPILVFVGESNLTKDCRMIGKFELSGIAPAPRGTPQIEVTFDLDPYGKLIVTAVDKTSGKSEKITITDVWRMSQEEIDEMVREFEEVNRKQREWADSRNSLESYLYNMESEVNDEDELGHKLEPEEKNGIKDVVREALEWLHADGNKDVQDFEEKQKEVDRVRNTIRLRLFRQ